MKIHKAGPQKVAMYIGLGRYEYVPAPLCVGAKAVYKGKSFLVHRLKSKVTCKHCLRKLNANALSLGASSKSCKEA